MRMPQIYVMFCFGIYSLRVSEDTKVVFGDTDIDGSSPYRQEASFHRQFVHPEYEILVNYRPTILKIDPPVNITDYVRPICLSDITNESDVYDNCWIAGFGQINAVRKYQLGLCASRPGPVCSTRPSLCVQVLYVI